MLEPYRPLKGDPITEPSRAACQDIEREAEEAKEAAEEAARKARAQGCWFRV